jgi:hypothetical protein
MEAVGEKLLAVFVMLAILVLAPPICSHPGFQPIWIPLVALTEAVLYRLELWCDDVEAYTLQPQVRWAWCCVAVLSAFVVVCIVVFPAFRCRCVRSAARAKDHTASYHNMFVPLHSKRKTA